MYQGCIDHNSGCIGASASRAIYRSWYITTIYSGIAREKGDRRLGKDGRKIHWNIWEKLSEWIHGPQRPFDNVALYIANNGRRPADSFSIFYEWSSRLRVQALHVSWHSITTYGPAHVNIWRCRWNLAEHPPDNNPRIVI